jgi:hypothetical protein
LTISPGLINNSYLFCGHLPCPARLLMGKDQPGTGGVNAT